MNKLVLIILCTLVLTGCNSQQIVSEWEPIPWQGTVVDQTEQTFDVYFYIANDNWENGELIGCGDSITAMQKTVYAAPEDLLWEAVIALLTAQNDIYGPFWLSNIFETMSLSLESIVTNNGITTINIQWPLSIGGVCDHPRIQEQLTRTVAQFFPNNNFVITIDNIALDQALNLQ